MAAQANPKASECKKCRLWRPVNNNVDDLTALQKKHKDGKKLDFDGTQLDTDESDVVENMAFGPEDILLVELPFNGKFLFEKAAPATSHDDT